MKISTAFRISIVFTIILSSHLLAQEQYYAVFMGGKKVGHAVRSRVVSAGTVTTTEKIDITMSRVGVPVNIKTAETNIETTDGKPLGFELEQDIGMMPMKTFGRLGSDGVMNVTTNSMGMEQKSSFNWPGGAVMAEGLRLLTLKKGLKEGTAYTVKVFSAGVMQPVDAQIQIGAKQNVDLLGRVELLTKVTNTLNMPSAGNMTIVEYVDDDLELQKSITPMAGVQVELIACTRQVAMQDNEVFDLTDKMFLASPVPLDNPDSANSITYRLRPLEPGFVLKIPSTDNQKVRRGLGGKVMVKVRPLRAPGHAGFPYKGGDADILEATKPTRYIQSGDEQIISLAKRVIGNTRNASEAARKIEQFVAGYIQNASLSVGYASATEVLASRTGDCTEFAVLTAALCRAVGIPARMITGVAYIEDFAGIGQRFGGHAWVEAYLGGRWVGLDAAFKSIGLHGYGPGHIALAVGNGDPEDFLGLVNTIGQFEIEKVTVTQ